MKWLLILVILFGAVDAANSAEESLGSKIKKFLSLIQVRLRSQTSKTLDEEATPTPSPTASPKSKESFADSIPDAEEQIKTQESVSYSNTGANRRRQQRLRPRVRRNHPKLVEEKKAGLM